MLQVNVRMSYRDPWMTVLLIRKSRGSWRVPVRSGIITIRVENRSTNVKIKFNNLCLTTIPGNNSKSKIQRSLSCAFLFLTMTYFHALITYFECSTYCKYLDRFALFNHLLFFATFCCVSDNSLGDLYEHRPPSSVNQGTPSHLSIGTSSIHTTTWTEGTPSYTESSLSGSLGRASADPG